jgi:hypothetical protein
MYPLGILLHNLLQIGIILVVKKDGHRQLGILRK